MLLDTLASSARESQLFLSDACAFLRGLIRWGY
jgi:hypothetical protein